jgi:hypothetical protein
MAESEAKPPASLVRPAWIAAIVGLTSFWVSRGVLQPPRTALPREPVENPAAAPTPELSAASEAQTRPEAAPAFAAAEAAAHAPVRVAGARSAPSEPSSRHGDLPRTDFDLFRRLFTEPTKVVSRDLVRHVLLNPRDQVMTVADVEFLESIVASFREPLASLDSQVGQSQTREFDALIAAGKQPSATTKSGPDGKLRARILLNSDAFVLKADGGQAVQYDASFVELPATHRALRSRTELAYQLGGTLLAYFASLSALTASEAQVRQGELMDLAAKYLNR